VCVCVFESGGQDEIKGMSFALVPCSLAGGYKGRPHQECMGDACLYKCIWDGVRVEQSFIAGPLKQTLERCRILWLGGENTSRPVSLGQMLCLFAIFVCKKMDS